MDISETLKERGNNYGAFDRHASISQALKDAAWHCQNAKLQPIHREAIDMILHKLARIINGDPNYVDSWHDIAGYATLVEQHISKSKI